MSVVVGYPAQESRIIYRVRLDRKSQCVPCKLLGTIAMAISEVVLDHCVGWSGWWVRDGPAIW